jgi:hypothetical protein
MRPVTCEAERFAEFLTVDVGQKGEDDTENGGEFQIFCEMSTNPEFFC